MRLAVDTNALIGVVLRAEGLRLLDHPALDLFVAEDAWDELAYELPRRAARLAASRGIDAAAAATLVNRALAAAGDAVLVIPREAYLPLEGTARLRADRDPADWPTVAIALITSSAIWTEDQDFFGCGLATWRTSVLRAALSPATNPGADAD